MIETEMMIRGPDLVVGFYIVLSSADTRSVLVYDMNVSAMSLASKKTVRLRGVSGTRLVIIAHIFSFTG